MKYNLEMVRGDTLTFGFELEGVDSITSAYFSVKKNKNESEYALQKALYHGIDRVESSKYRVRVPPSDSEKLEAGIYYYDLQVETNGDRFTILYGQLTVVQDVTREG